MARNTSGFFDGELAVLRAIPGVIAADSATLTDANFPVAAAISCDGLDTIFLGVEITAGTAPTATLELLFRDADAAVVMDPVPFLAPPLPRQRPLSSRRTAISKRSAASAPRWSTCA